MGSGVRCHADDEEKRENAAERGSCSLKVGVGIRLVVRAGHEGFAIHWHFPKIPNLSSLDAVCGQSDMAGLVVLENTAMLLCLPFSLGGLIGGR